MFAVSSLVVVTATLTVLGLHPPYALACVMFALLGASMLPMLPLTLVGIRLHVGGLPMVFADAACSGKRGGMHVSRS